jgi:hypothetical protein
MCDIRLNNQTEVFIKSQNRTHTMSTMKLSDIQWWCFRLIKFVDKNFEHDSLKEPTTWNISMLITDKIDYFISLKSNLCKYNFVVDLIEK